MPATETRTVKFRKNYDLSDVELPVQPQILTAILDLKEDTSMNFSDMEDLVRSDQTIATLLLKVVNSSFYARGNEIKTLRQAIGLLGFRTVQSLAAAVSIRSMFKGADYARFRRHVWEHSVVVAIIARTVAAKLGRQELMEVAFVAGLLHDIGKVVLNSLDRELFIKVIDTVEEENCTFCVAEQQHFGVNHAQVGQICAQTWQLPKVYKAVVAEHEDGARSIGAEQGDLDVVAIVCFANHIAKRYGYGLFTAADEQREGNILKSVPLDDDACSFFLNEFQEDIKGNEIYQVFNSLT